MTGLEYDPNPDNNLATFTLNIPYVDPDNHIPEVPSNLPDNGMATLPPISNIEDLMDLDIFQPGTNPVPPNNPPNPPGPDTPDPNPPGPNPPTEPQKPSTQLGRDIAGVRQAVSRGVLDESVIPDWNLDPFESTEERDEDGIPLWVYLMAILGFIGAFLAYRYSSALSEYLTNVWNGILNAIIAFWFYLSYLGYSFKKFLEDAILNISVQYGNYLIPILQEMVFTPVTGVGLTTVIGLGLRTLAVRFPMLEPLIAPAISVLDQLSYLELSQKIKEIFNKKS